MNKYLIDEWEPESPRFWHDGGKAAARRNLWISIPALLFAYAVWMVWSIVVVKLPDIGFRYSTNQLFLLLALPGLSAASLRIFYAFMVPLFGGRKWTAISTASLLVPAFGLGFAVQDPSTSFPTMLSLALLCGLGGGNFASSMANISVFFPKAQRQDALGMHAALGNLGVAVAQLLLPFAISIPLFGLSGGAPQTWLAGDEVQRLWLQNAGFIWVPFIVISTFVAWFGMNDLAARESSFAEQAVIFKRPHNWLMSCLHLGTQGSFIGYAASFPLLVQTQFPEIDTLRFAFLGPLVGALACFAGGHAVKRLGGARVTFCVFVVMIVAVCGALLSLPSAGSEGHFAGFFAMFLLLFATAGFGTGATLRMTPAVFVAERLRAAAGKGAAAHAQAFTEGSNEAAAALAFSSAVAACGAFFIPKSYGSSIAATGSPAMALSFFIGFYLVCLAITWRYYLHKDADLRL